MRILFVTSNRLGDAVLSTGLLDHLIRAYPSSRITVACGPVAAGIFQRMPNLDRVILVQKQPLGRHWLPLWAATVGHWWDLVVDIRGSALSWIVPARRRAVMRPSSGHKTQQLARVLNITPPPRPVVWFNAGDAAKAASLIPPDRPVIVLAPTANWKPKTWPAERFHALFQRLADTRFPDAIPAVIAGPGPTEAELSQPLLDALPAALNLVGRLSLPEIAAFFSRASLFIGNDSGLMHLAAAAGVPTLGLFGPTNAAEYAPSGVTASALRGATQTMESLTVDEAFDAVLSLCSG